MQNKTTDIAKIAIKMALTSREEEVSLSKLYFKEGINTTAVDIGGKLPNITGKIIESTLVAAKRKNIIKDCHLHDGAITGAVREALQQINAKTNGLNVGGKIGIARKGEHLSVAIFFSIGLLHLNEVVIGLGHRSIPIVSEIEEENQ